jgi:hypothetical protein
MTVSRNRIEAYTDEGTGTTYRDVEPILTPAFLANQQLTWQATSRLTLTADSRYQGRSYLAPRGDERLTSPPRAGRCTRGSVPRILRSPACASARAASGVGSDKRPRPSYLPTSLDITLVSDAESNAAEFRPGR